jgi:hypothetical protein
MSERRRARTALVALVVAGAVALAGCAGIPTSGPVHTGAAVVVAQDQPVTQSIAQPPRPGADPQQIVQGFVFASASFDSDQTVAREYLTPDVSKSWVPSGSLIYDQPTSGYKQVGTNQVDLTATELGTISAQGEYTDAPEDTTKVTHFRLRRVDGQWRIANPPPGLLLTTAERDRNYRAFDVYFPDQTSRVLVPDQILVPVGPGTETALVNAVIAGPTSWLAPAVHTAVPTGTKLFPDSAPRNLGGIVQITLASTPGSPTSPDPVAMAAQFVWTLRQLHPLGVNGVAISVNGIVLQSPDGQPFWAWDSLPQFDPDGQIPNPSPAAVFAADKGLELLDADKGTPVRGPLGDGAVQLTKPGLSFDERSVAGLDKGGHRLYVSAVGLGTKVPPAVIAAATALIAPSWDRFGVVWTVDNRSTGPVVWMDQPGSPPKKVATSSLPAGRILAMRIARDGVRVVLVIRKTGDATAGVYLARIEQRGDPQMTLSGFRPLSTPLANVSDVAWFTSDQLAILGQQTSGGAQEPLTVDLSGSSVSSLGPIASSAVSTPVIESVTAAPNQPILVSTSDGKIYRYVAGGWIPLLAGRFPSYPG